VPSVRKIDAFYNNRHVVVGNTLYWAYFLEDDEYSNQYYIFKAYDLDRDEWFNTSFSPREFFSEI
jgi:hypothetical protein